MEEIYSVFIPADLFKPGFCSSIRMNNIDHSGLKGGAFRLRATGSKHDGSLLRAAEYLFFLDGMYKIIDNPEQMTFNTTVGYLCLMVKKKNKKSRVYWEVRIEKSIDLAELLFKKTTNNFTEKLLKISDEHPGEEALVLSAVSNGRANQFIYLSSN